MGTVHGTVGAAFDCIEDGLSDALKAGKFMTVTWFVNEAGELRCRRTTWNFPTGKFDEAVQQLRQLLDEELCPVPLPLAVAAFLQEAGGGGTTTDEETQDELEADA